MINLTSTSVTSFHSTLLRLTAIVSLVLGYTSGSGEVLTQFLWCF